MVFATDHRTLAALAPAAPMKGYPGLVRQSVGVRKLFMPGTLREIDHPYHPDSYLAGIRYLFPTRMHGKTGDGGALQLVANLLNGSSWASCRAKTPRIHSHQQN